MGLEPQQGEHVWPPCSLTLWVPSCLTPCPASEASVTAESGENSHLQRLRGKTLTPAPVGERDTLLFCGSFLTTSVEGPSQCLPCAEQGRLYRLVQAQRSPPQKRFEESPAWPCHQPPGSPTSQAEPQAPQRPQVMGACVYWTAWEEPGGHKCWLLGEDVRSKSRTAGGTSHTGQHLGVSGLSPQPP